MEPEILYKKMDDLGEGPTYDERRNRVYWIDIRGKKFHYLDLGNGGMETFASIGMISSIVPTNGDMMAATVDHGFYLIDEKGKHTLITGVERNQKSTRFNDGKADPYGNYVAGSMDLEEKRPIGSLYVLSGKTTKVLLKNLTISNGIAWDTKKMIFYHIDTPQRRVDAYSYDKNMDIKKIGVAADFKGETGNPDGMTIDADGNIWVAHWGGNRISVFNPENQKKIDEIKFPAQNITSCVFAGDGLRDLYVSSASNGNTDDLGGSLFKVKTDYEGSKTFVFKISGLS
ncbi:MAG: SMP-30/gluconolactonase/LRE family protein [Thermoplasmata archaeon]